MTTPADILDFWFSEIQPAQWWNKSDDFDRLIATRFGAVLQAAARCELYAWRATPAGRLAEVIVLDQFSRNINRGEAQAFANDALALVSSNARRNVARSLGEARLARFAAVECGSALLGKAYRLRQVAQRCGAMSR